MRDDYYGELVHATERHRAVGWENEVATHTRYEAVLGRVRTGDFVLDLGAGLGELGRYLSARREVSYLGVERDARLVARGRLIEPVMPLEEADFMVADLPTADIVALVGAVVDGASLRSDAVRFGRLRRLFERAQSFARREVVVVVLDQDALERDPIRSQEVALGGMRLAELAWLAPDARVERILATDLVVTMPGTGR